MQTIGRMRRKIRLKERKVKNDQEKESPKKAVIIRFK
jgi:hypothetical protein